ncbi:MAG TPA: DUF2779 domain-containing protein [Burkholderiales bacterium]|nr:DUF2779 domain-containing protein [Burkholderiales bacterium]
MAQTVFGPGEVISLPGQRDIPGALTRTEQALAAGATTLFEATFKADDVVVMADVYKTDGSSAHALEVKSASKVKDYYLEDCATQSHVMRAAGVPLKSISVVHIDTSFTYQGDGNYQGLFRTADVSRDVEALVPRVPGWIEGAKKALAGPEPDVAPGDQCSEPFECPFQSYCIKKPEGFPVAILPYIHKRLPALAKRGIVDVREIPDGELTNPQQLMVWTASRSGSAVTNAEAVEPLRKLGYPRFYLDFETINFAVPMWAGVKPYQQIPFQWSLRIERAHGNLERDDFLDVSGANPSRAAMERLLAKVGTEGPILAYSSFESTRLNDMAKLLPDLAERILKLKDRVVDLCAIAKQAYYHPSMMGSWSIKALLPAITTEPELNYEALEEVRDGIAAQNAYVEAIDRGTTAERREQLRQHLLRYCGLDALAMVRVMQFLASI